MKLLLWLHDTGELQTELTRSEAEKRLGDAIGLQFTGAQTEEGFQLSHKDVNPLRPEITVRLSEGDEGTAAAVEMKLHPVMMVFLCIWLVLVAAIAIWRNILLLVTIPLFWLITILAFSVGADAARKALLETLDAVEIIG